MRRLAIQNLFKCMGMIQIFIDPHPSPIGILYSPPGLNYDLSIELYTCIYSWTVEQIGRNFFLLLKITQI